MRSTDAAAGHEAAEREAAVRRYWDEIWTMGRLELAAEFYAPAYHQDGEATSPAEFEEGAAAWRAHFTDFRAEVAEVFSAGERVVSRVTYSGTHTGDFRRVPARGLPFTGSGIDIFEFEGDRVVRHWHATDHLELFRQLGAVLAPEPAPSGTEGR